MNEPRFRFLIVTDQNLVIIGICDFDPAEEIYERTMWGLFNNPEMETKYGEVVIIAPLHGRVSLVLTPDGVTKLGKLPTYTIVA